MTDDRPDWKRLQEKMSAKSKPRYWIGKVGETDDFGEPITTTFIDGATRMGPWAIMAPSSWKDMGVGKLGIGYGQRYEKITSKHADSRLIGKWLKVEG